MVGFSDWLRQQAAAGSADLKTVIDLADQPANQADWSSFSHRNDIAPYVQFVFRKAPASEQERLVASLTAAFGQWSGLLPEPAAKKGFLSGEIVLLIAAILIAAVIAVGMYSGQVALLAEVEYARGLITFLFATCTIAAILIVIISVIWMAPSEIKDRFQPAKDIVTILIGVLGTILGFYFGSAGGENGGLAVANLVPANEIVVAGDSTTVTAALSGGSAPYRYGVEFSGDGALPNAIAETTSPGGAISFPVAVPADAKTPGVLRFVLRSQDASGNRVTAPGSIFVVAQPSPAPGEPNDPATGAAPGATQ